MAGISDFVVSLFSGAIQTVGESKLKDVLQDLHDSNVDDYQAAIQGGDALIKHLQPLVTKSANKIDDAVLGALREAITESAISNGITL